MKPPALRQGATIGVIAPSWCGPGLFPHRVERGVRFLESLGYRVEVGPNASGRRGYLSGTAEERVADIHGFFAASHVQAILAAIGGNHSCHLLPLLDFDLIRRNPKILVGFSDVTVLNLAVHAVTGLVTFNGPSLMTDFGEYPQPLAYTVESFQRVVARAEPAGVLTPSPVWTEEHLEWRQKLDLTRPRALSPSPGWTWLKAGRASGRWSAAASSRWSTFAGRHTGRPWMARSGSSRRRRRCRRRPGSTRRCRTTRTWASWRG
jgi:muramoyltetrapeptide carboxypeptidase